MTNLKKFKKPKVFSVSDGKFSFKFISKGKNYIIGKSNENFYLLSKKDIKQNIFFIVKNFMLMY